VCCEVFENSRIYPKKASHTASNDEATFLARRRRAEGRKPANFEHQTRPNHTAHMHGYAGSLYSKQKGGTSKGSQPKGAEGTTDGSQVPPPSAGSFWSSAVAAEVEVAKNDSAAPSEASEPPPADLPDSIAHPAGRSDPIAATTQPPQLGSTWSSYGAGLLRSGLSAASSTYEVASAKASATYAVASAKAPGLVAGLKAGAATAASSAASAAKTGTEAASTGLQAMKASGASTMEAAADAGAATLRGAHPAVATAAGAVLGAAAGAGVGPTGTVVCAAAGAAAAQVAHAQVQDRIAVQVGLQEVLERRGAAESIAALEQLAAGAGGRLRAASAALSDVERTAAEGSALYLYKLCDEASSRPAPPRAAPPPHRPLPPPLPPAAAEAFGAAARQVGFRLEEGAHALERLKRRLAALQQAGAAEPAGEPAVAEPAAAPVTSAAPAAAAPAADGTAAAEPEPASPGPACVESAEAAEAQEQESRTAQRRQLEVYAARAAIGAAESCVAQVAPLPVSPRLYPPLPPPCGLPLALERRAWRARLRSCARRRCTLAPALALALTLTSCARRRS